MYQIECLAIKIHKNISYISTLCILLFSSEINLSGVTIAA